MSDAKLIQDIYDTALNPSALPEVLQDISGRIGAYGAMIFDCVQENDRRYVDMRQISTCYDWEATRAYAQKYNLEELADQDHLAHLSLPTDGINLVHDKNLYLNGREPLANLAAMERPRRAVVQRGLEHRTVCISICNRDQIRHGRANQMGREYSVSSIKIADDGGHRDGPKTG